MNKSPRGRRILAENQIWKFSHPKFLCGRPDLLDDIKEKRGNLHVHSPTKSLRQLEKHNRKTILSQQPVIEI